MINVFKELQIIVKTLKSNNYNLSKLSTAEKTQSKKE